MRSILSPAIFVPLAHGVFGPFDEFLPIVIIVVLAGLLGFTWWNGRKSPLTTEEDEQQTDPTADAIQTDPTLKPEIEADESHYTVR